MSAICGTLPLRAAADASGIDRQMTALAHRGPDRAEAWRGPQAQLAALSLRVTPEDRWDRQPLHDREAGIVLVADIRLDNRGELADALGLSAADIAAWADARLLLAAWRRWGADCLDRLLGDFAVAVWDAPARVLHLARDLMGQRQLYYHDGPDLFAFATEIKGLWALPQVPRALDTQVLAAQLVHFHRGWVDRTLYSGINSLPGGHHLAVGADGSRRLRRHGEFRPDPAMHCRSEAEYAEAYREVLGRAVACRLRCTGPAGLMFSGGFDSGAIAAVAGPALQGEGRRLVGVASVLPDGHVGPERDARPWVERCRAVMPHLDLHCLTAPGTMALDGLDQALRIADGLPVHDSYAESELMRKAAATGCRVIMDGFGGDQTLNWRGAGALLDLLRRGRVATLWREARALARQRGVSLAAVGRHHLMAPLVPHWLRRLRPVQADDDPVVGLLAPAFCAATGFDVADKPYPRHWPADPVWVLRHYIDRCRRRPFVPWGNLAASYRMDLARPFHDRRVVELALALPVGLSLRHGRNRHLARVALADLLPAEYAVRDHRNDEIAPDFAARHRAQLPRLLDEADRLDRSGALADVLAPGAIRAVLTAPGTMDDRRLHAAVHGLAIGRCLAWFRGVNLPD